MLDRREVLRAGAAFVGCSLLDAEREAMLGGTAARLLGIKS